METATLFSQQETSLPKIRPIKYWQTKTVDTQNIKKYRVYRFKNLKVNNPPLAVTEGTLPKHLINKPSKNLEKQGFLSSTSYCLNNRTAFQNAYFASRIKVKSSSLYSFRLDVALKIKERRARTLFNSLTSLKNLQDFHIHFFFCEFPATNYLYCLFKCLPYLRRLKHFSFHDVICKGLEARHLKTLCLFLSRSSQLQSLKLSFGDQKQLLETFIPLLPKLTSLTKIHLSIPGDGSVKEEKILQLFKNLSCIKTLIDFSFNLYSWEETSQDRPLIEGLQCLNPSSIKKLSLTFCEAFPPKVLGKIYEIIKEFTFLQKLELSLPNSKGIPNENLSSCLRRFESLTSLRLNFPGFTQPLATAFSSLQKLTYLNLRFNNPQISHHQAQHLALALRELKSSLKFLEIQFAYESSLSDAMLGAGLCFALPQLTQLKHFSLELSSTKNLTSDGIRTLSSAIQKLSNLSSLTLNFAGTQGVDEKAIHALSQTFESLPSLHSIMLDLAYCGRIDPRGDSFQSLYAILNERMNICCLRLKLPTYRDPLQSIAKLRKRLELRISQTANTFEITTL